MLRHIKINWKLELNKLRLEKMGKGNEIEKVKEEECIRRRRKSGKKMKKRSKEKEMEDEVNEKKGK